MVARALAHRAELDNVTVLTNDLHIALELQPAIPRLSVVVTGGTLRGDSPDLGDPLGGLLLAGIAADVTIVGCDAISAARGLTTSSVGSVEAARRLVDAGDRTVVVADATQVGSSSPARVVPVDQVDLLITGSRADPDEVDRLRERGVAVELVE
jgi:DeoR family transcriptional regulator, aga operon transcriptional repressor